MNTPPPEQPSAEQVPLWLWRLAVAGFGLLLAGIIALALGLALGLADPRPVGRLAWFDEFEHSEAEWQRLAGNAPHFQPAALTVTAAAGGDVLLLTHTKTSDAFTFEVAGAQIAGVPGAGYGLVFGVADASHYTAVLINNNGFLTAYRQAGSTRTVYWAPQEWPHILLGNQANRVRVDVRNELAEVRINDEFFLAIPAVPGDIGLRVEHTAAAQTVRYDWARLWEP